MLVRYLILEGKVSRQTQRLPSSSSRRPSVQPYINEGLMSQLRQSLAVLVLALVGLVGCEHEPRTVGDANPARVADAKEALRDLWVGHIFWVRNVVLDNATKNPAARDAAEKEGMANTKQIASTMTPFYGVPRRRNSSACWPSIMARLKNIRKPLSRGVSTSRMPRLPTWRRMPTTSPYSSAESIPTCRKTPFGV